MDRIIYWVDEDERIWSPERKILLGLGFNVETFSNASDALDNLLNTPPQDVELVILDIMLRQGYNLNIFSDSETRKGLDTGIVLTSELISCSTDWTSRLLLFSRANKPDHVARIRALATKYKLPYLRKERSNQGRNFVHKLKELGLIMEK